MYTVNIENPDKLFFTSDNHHGHFNICKYCHRPFESRSYMDKTLIDNWNSVVPEDGIVVCCGDFMFPHETGFKEYWKYMKQLNFKTLFLCRGNHDRIEMGVYDMYHPDVCKNTILHRKIEDCPKVIVNDFIKINVEGISIFACHYPMLSYPTDYQVFGHIHTLSDGTCYGIDGDVNTRLRKTQYDVGVDKNGYKPVSYWELVDIFRNKAKNS